MTLMNNIAVLNAGGTFNKRYMPILGRLEVPHDNVAVNHILSQLTYEIDVQGAIFKDSLLMTDEDRSSLVEIINKYPPQKRIVIVHGTDTMHLTAQTLCEAFVGSNRVIMLTGSMVPFAVDPIEATSNLSMAIAVAQFVQPGVYICLQGVVGPSDCVRKNRERGQFEFVGASGSPTKI